jgi:hypothetical protein
MVVRLRWLDKVLKDLDRIVRSFYFHNIFPFILPTLFLAMCFNNIPFYYEVYEGGLRALNHPPSSVVHLCSCKRNCP